MRGAANRRSLDNHGPTWREAPRLSDHLDEIVNWRAQIEVDYRVLVQFYNLMNIREPAQELHAAQVAQEHRVLETCAVPLHQSQDLAKAHVIADVVRDQVSAP